MRYAIINPKDRTITAHRANDYRDAMQTAGLKSGEVDFGTAASWPDGRTLTIIVYEHGLIRGNTDEYFAFNGGLYNGNAVLYASDPEGATVDFPEPLLDHFSDGCPLLIWFNDINEIETAIACGRVAQPQTAINGNIIWSWIGRKEPKQ